MSFFVVASECGGDGATLLLTSSLAIYNMPYDIISLIGQFGSCCINYDIHKQLESYHTVLIIHDFLWL